MTNEFIKNMVCIDSERGEVLLAKFPGELADDEKIVLLRHLGICPHCAFLLQVHESASRSLNEGNLPENTWMREFYEKAAGARRRVRDEFEQLLEEELEDRQSNSPLERPVVLTVFRGTEIVKTVVLSKKQKEEKIPIEEEGDYEVRSSSGEVISLGAITRKDLWQGPDELKEIRRASGWKAGDDMGSTLRSSVLKRTSDGKVSINLYPGIDGGSLHIQIDG